MQDPATAAVCRDMHVLNNVGSASSCFVGLSFPGPPPTLGADHITSQPGVCRSKWSDLSGKQPASCLPDNELTNNAPLPCARVTREDCTSASVVKEKEPQTASPLHPDRSGDRSRPTDDEGGEASGKG